MAGGRDYWARYSRDLDGAWHAIDDIREVLGTPAEVAGLRQKLVDMATADEVAEKVAEQVKARTFLGLSVIQKAAAAIGAAAVLASAILNIVQRAH